MNCLDESICSVNKENNSGYYRLHTIWKKDGFFINITSKNGAWRGEFVRCLIRSKEFFQMTPNDVAKMSVLLEMEPQSYLSQCKEVLTCHGGLPGIVYAVENGSFTWKKVEDEDSGIKIKMGSVMLEPTNFVDTIQNLVTAALNCNKNLQEKLKKTSEEKEKVLESKHELLKKLNELIEMKETMENDLYARFILLINAKKKKILELENLLEENFKKNKNGKLRNSGDPYEIDTDIDSEGETQKSSARKMKRRIKEETERKKSKVRTEGPVRKGIKSNEEDSLSEKRSDLECRSISPKPSTSKEESENMQKESQGTGLTKALTKDELYNYFYGEF